MLRKVVQEARQMGEDGWICKSMMDFPLVFSPYLVHVQSLAVFRKGAEARNSMMDNGGVGGTESTMACDP